MLRGGKNTRLDLAGLLTQSSKTKTSKNK